MSVYALLYVYTVALDSICTIRWTELKLSM